MKIKNKATGQVLEFSKRYARIRRMQKRVFAWADTLKPYLSKLGAGFRLVMIRLSYSPENTWKANDIRDFMLIARRELGKNMVAYAHVAELQKRGEVHYHVLLLVRQGTNIPVPDKSGWWPWGSTRIETARSPYYVCTYAGKEYQKMGVFPKGLRMFAVWISPELLDQVQRWFFRLSALPAWLKSSILDNVGSLLLQKAKRKPGGGWIVGDLTFTSPWEVIDCT